VASPHLQQNCANSTRSIWERVNQDEMKSRKVCENVAKKALKTGKNVVVDRCNFDIHQLRVWINLAAEYNAVCDALFFDTSRHECVARVRVREDHPTGVQGEKSIAIVNRFIRNFTYPTTNEGFRLVRELSNIKLISETTELPSTELCDIGPPTAPELWPKSAIDSVITYFPSNALNLTPSSDAKQSDPVSGCNTWMEHLAVQVSENCSIDDLVTDFQTKSNV